MKQLEADPWDGVAAKYPPGAKYTGRVTNITDYGAFVELEPGVEGLVHVSEMSWTKKNVHPGKIVATSQEVEVLVLDVDASKRRISLGLKQVQRNPWEQFVDDHPIGGVVEGEIRNMTEFGLFIGIGPDIDGMVHMSDLSWDEPGELAMAKYEKGQIIKAKVLDVDVEKERISLGVKQLADDPAAAVLDRVQKGTVVTCIVTAVQSNGIEVKVDDVLTGFIRRAELARDKGDQRPDRFAIGEKVDAKVIAVDRAARKLSLTIKGKEMEEDKKAIAEFGTSDSGASLGDILGAAIRRRNQQVQTED
jgi:small subunit ribosomal protein S1